MVPKKQYRIRSREKGVFFASFSQHSLQRLEERKMDILEVLTSLSVHSDELLDQAEKGEIVFLDEGRGFSIVLSVSKTEKDIHYLNVITTLNEVPRMADGTPRFVAEEMIFATY